VTMLNTGATKKFTEGWQAIFGRKKAAKQQAQPAKKPQAAAKKPAMTRKSGKKTAAKKAAR
jgi:hypothetical protein